MDQEQSQQEPSQEKQNPFKSFIDFLAEDRKSDRQEIQKMREKIKLIEKNLDELEHPKQGGE